MKLAFLTGSLAPGQDGVGDYTRRLAGELTAAGHRCRLIALQDSAAHDISSDVLRLASAAPWRDRAAQALAALCEFEPDWVSLQLVCYGLDPRGFIGALAPHLAPLFTAWPTHVMLHELWIGEATGYGWKDRAIGWVQRRGVLRLLRTIRPALVHTSNPVYRELLRRHGVTARELPLFGNIAIAESPAAAVKTGLFTSASLPPGFAREAWWVAGVFGTIHPQWWPADFLRRLAALAEEKGKRLLLLHLGRTPEAGRAVWQRLTEFFAGRIAFSATGKLPEAEVSALLQQLDFGIATSPWALSGKSGSIAAMLEHGLPVAVPEAGWQLRRGPTPEPAAPPLLVRAEPFLAALRAGQLPRRAPQSRLPEVAAQMLRELHAAEER